MSNRKRNRNQIEENDKENDAPHNKRRRLTLSQNSNASNQSTEYNKLIHIGSNIIKQARKYEKAERTKEALVVYQIAIEHFFPEHEGLHDN